MKPKKLPPPNCAKCGKPATHDVCIMAHECQWRSSFDGSMSFPEKSRTTLHLSAAACADCAKQAARLALEFLQGKEEMR